MSENLKRAESLFNRIMNQNKPLSAELNPRSNYLKNQNSCASANQNSNGINSYNSGNGGNNSNNSNISNHYHHSSGHRSYRSYNKYNTHHNNNSNNHHSNNNNNGNNFSNYISNGNPHSNGASTSIGPQSFDLPKRDPIAECQEAVAALEGEQHVLLYCWTIWYHSRSRKNQLVVGEENTNGIATSLQDNKNQVALVDLYLLAATEIEFPCFGNSSKSVKPIASLEQMWLSMSVLKRSHDLSNGSELLIFKTGVNPVWEDPFNAKGGRWVFRFNHRTNNPSFTMEAADALRGRHRATLVWERLVLKTLSGLLLPCRKELQDPLLSDIAGLVLSVRRDEEIISVWNSNSSFAKKKQDDDDKKGVFTAFHARRVYCDAILRVIREVDLIMQGSDCVDTQATLSSERVSGVTFEYRLHSDNSNSYNPNDRSRRGKSYHHHQHHHRDDQRGERIERSERPERFERLERDEM